MHTIMLNKSRLTTVFLLVMALFFSGLLQGSAHAAPAQAAVSFELCATTGSVTMPDSNFVSIWGYALGDCSGSPTASLPGPAIVVNEGDDVTITLHNNLSEDTALYFQGQAMIPDLTGAAANGGSQVYQFTASSPGTYLYEAGLLPNAQHQVAMGLYGSLIVQSLTAGTAYGTLDSAFNTEATLVLSELDPNIGASADPAGFDMRNYHPQYFLINGQAYPNTTPFMAAAGDRVLLRFVNAGLQSHSMTMLGFSQSIVAMDGSPLNHLSYVVAETIYPGLTMDSIVSVPASTPEGSQYPIYDANLTLSNSSAPGMGGMLALFEVGAPLPPGVDTVGPTTSDILLTPSLVTGATSVTVDASVNDVLTGGSDIAAAEYYIDNTSGSPIAMSATDLAFDSPTEAVSASIPAATVGALLTGNHTIYVRGMDSAGNWGAFSSAILMVDNTGPTTSALVLTPGASNGSVDVSLSGTANDTASGNSDIAAAEYSIDGGAAVAMSVSPSGAKIASLSATIPVATVNALSEGHHQVSVRSQDSQGNWGDPAMIDLVVDKSGPFTGSVVAMPNPTNGVIGYNSSTLAVRVTASFADTLSNVNGAEGFIDAVGAEGTGFIFIPTDGVFNSLSENGYVDIPLVTIIGLSDGNHTIYVRGKDAAGNWGDTSSVILEVDKTPPAISAVSASPNPTGGANSVTLSATASDAGSNVVAAEWFTGADTGVGNGTAMTISGTGPWSLSALIDVSGFAEGDYTLYVRAMDTAGNWSATGSTTLTVTHPLYFSTLGGANPPGVGGSADDADIYFWDGAAFSRVFDASASNLPNNANVDGYVRIDDNHFYLSFSGTNTSVPGLGNVQDEDVVYFNAGVWSVYFDGTAAGLTSNDLDIDAIDIVGGVLYFSTAGAANPPGVSGTASAADIYAWNGVSFSRVFDATAAGLGSANVDGFVRIDDTHFFLSFSDTNTSVPGIGNVQDEDVVYYNAGAWIVYFDGTAKGLTNNNHDLDAFDLP